MPLLQLTLDEIRGEIRTYVVETFCDGRGAGIGPDTALVTTGIVDSGGVVMVAEFLERRFGIVIADADVGLDSFNTVAALAGLVARKLGA